MAEFLVRMRRAAESLVRRAFHFYWRFARGMTLGVRAIVIDGQGRVLLVRHSYVDGWHLPGGGVEVGETARDALVRELAEEGRVAVVGDPELHGFFFNRQASRRDHVAVYVVRTYTVDGPFVPNGEIVDCGFYAYDTLPEGTTKGTRRRLAEVFDGQALSAVWL